jgi:hypothetical protein
VSGCELGSDVDDIIIDGVVEARGRNITVCLSYISTE